MSKTCPVPEISCAQCGKDKPAGEFVGKTGKTVRTCQDCRTLYAGNYGIRGSVPRRLLRVYAPAPQVTWVPKSGNQKLGLIPTAIVSPETCPPSCGLYGKGCYAEFGASGHHWRNVARDGLAWEAFLGRVRALPEGQLWRYASAGDLPGNGETLDEERLMALAEANRGRRGFTMTHKDPGEHAAAFRRAHALGFTINLSADSLAEADQKSGYGLPVVVIVPTDAPRYPALRTPAGRRLVLCPAEDRGLTCASCQLCAVPARRGIVAFRAHGQMKKTVTRVSRGEKV